MLYDLDITKQRKQFTNVIDHLLETGHKQKDIAKKIGLNSYDISHLISGSIVSDFMSCHQIAHIS